MTERLELIQGDITHVTADALVNAANSSALREIRAALERRPALERVTVVLFSERDLKVYQQALGASSHAP